jgi:hypothetical protein
VALADLLPYFQIVGQVALVVGAFFAGYQLLQVRRHRKEQTSLQIVTSFTTQEFRDAFARVYALPLGASPEDVKGASPDMEKAAATVMMTFEMLGVLVFHRMVPLETLDQAIGGFLRESWRRLEAYVRWKRNVLESPRWGEWYQWLAEHASVSRRREAGAYEVFREWRPE